MQEPIIIFGATGGYGAATARILVKAGHSVYLQGRSQSKLDILATELNIPTTDTFLVDLNDSESISNFLTSLSLRHTKIAGAVISVGAPFVNRLAHNNDWAAFSTQMDIHLKALHSLCTGLRSFLMSKEHVRRLVIVSTEFATGLPPVKTAPYSAAKAAALAYAKVIAQEWLRDSIRVQIVAPGMSRTALTEDMPEAYLRQVEERMPEGKLTSTEDVAEMIAFLLTPAGDCLYGQPVRVSRGSRV